MKISKQKAITWNILDDQGNQAASLHADVRMGSGVTTSSAIFMPQAIAEMGADFENAKEAFRMEVEELAAGEGAVMI